MGARKKKVGRRRHPKHPGVVLLKRKAADGRVISWRARYTDPDTGKVTYEDLNLAQWPTLEHRQAWAIERSRALIQRKREIDLGAPERPEAKRLDDVLNDYVNGAKARLRSKTLTTYNTAHTHFMAWVKRDGVRRTDQLTRAKLVSLRDFLIALPKQSAKRGGQRGQRDDSDRRRSALAVNREFRTIKTLLNHLRVAGLVNLNSDDIRDALKALPTDKDLPAYLTPSQIQKLLKAAQRHDAAMFAETREEHARLRPRGTTPRYTPIAPLIAFLLLSGMRRGEALAMTWAMVDLDALDSSGKKVGEIRLPGRITKTRHGRVLGLEVSPALSTLLAAMKLRAGHHDDDGRVFEGYTVGLVESSRDRLLNEYGAPAGFDWKLLRSTCDTYLVNAPGIYGTSNATFMASKQLGHSVMVAEKHYQGLKRGIPKDAHTLEAAMQIEDVMRRVVASISSARAA